MRFRKFMLGDYLNGEEGQHCWEFFFNFRKYFEERESNPRFYDFVTSIVNGPGYAKDAYSEERVKVHRVLDLMEADAVSCKTFDDFATAVSFEWPDGELSKLADNLARDMQPCIPYLSVKWFLQFSEFAFPFLVPRHFYKIEIICREFGIAMPKFPSKNDHKARCEYYLSLCRAIYDFRIESELSPTELCVFLYGYAMRFVDDIVQSRRHRNSKVFLLYACEEDRKIFLSKGVDSDEVTIWQGRPEMEPGDIVLLYERAPRSCLSSIWKTVTPGFDDPFDSWSGKVFIGEFAAIPEIPFSDLAADTVWSKKPLVAAHMQGGSGKACTSDEYEAILKMVKAKDPTFDLLRLPPVPEKTDFDEQGLLVEHDVEVKILEPLLRSLGFTEKDWVSQFIIRVGRDNTSRPDYIVNLSVVDGSPSAEYVFEAKYTIPTKRQLKRDYGQSLAYGKLLNAKAIALVSREGVWVWPRSVGKVPFPYESSTYFDWVQLKDAEAILRLKTLIG